MRIGFYLEKNFYEEKKKERKKSPGVFNFTDRS